jgi:hypothetical protein
MVEKEMIQNIDLNSDGPGAPTFDDPWEVALSFEKSGSGHTWDTAVFGEKSTALDGKDQYDVPKPGIPPYPYISAWFDAGLGSPYNRLWKDYRFYPHVDQTWDLYVQANTTGHPIFGTTDVVISWIIANVTMSEYTYVSLLDASDDFLANMKSVNTYTIYGMADDTPVHLKIKCHVNQAPTSEDKTITTAEDVTYTFLLTDFTFTDTDTATYGDQLTKVKITELETKGSLKLSAVDVTLNQEISRTDIIAGNLKFIPDLNEYGTAYANFKFKVSDGMLYSVSAYTMTIDVTEMNDPPVITTTDVTTATEDVLYSVDYDATDPDPVDTLFWALTSNAGFLSIISGTGVLSGTPTNVDVGSYYVNVSVSDGNGGSDYSNFTLTVINVNDPPVITTVDDLDAVEDVLYSVDYDCTDVDGGTPTWSLKTNAGFLSIVPATGVLSGTPTNVDVGSYYVNVSVSDGNGGSDYSNFTLTVIDIHHINVKKHWNLISLPVYDTISKTDIIVRYGGDDYTWDEAKGTIVLDTIYDWQRGSTQSYVATNTLEPGNGYWMWAYFDCELLIASNEVGTGHITDLQTKWNIMGYPYESSLVQTLLKIEYPPGTTLNWGDAVAGNIILGFIYGWDNTNQMYALKTTLMPGEGYWMYAYYDCTLKI